MRRTTGLTLLALALNSGPATAHYNMLLPATGGKKGEAVTLTYQWGHPFEHQLFDAPPPLSLTVREPDGKKTELRRDLEKVELTGRDSRVKAYRLRFTPPARGDYVFVLQTAPIWMAEEEEFFEDTVKVVLHVQAQDGWDAAAGADFEWLPLTRPYGLRAGMVFQAQALSTPEGAGKPAPRPLAGALVEVEHYNPAPPLDLPADELITHTARTDPNGVVTTTLTEGGWWCLTVGEKRGTREHEGKAYPVRRRSTLWVFVDHKAAGR
jgi:cobalt/nickel transport protein